MSRLAALLVVVQVAPPATDASRQAQREFAGRLHEEGRHAESAEQLEALLVQPGADPNLAYDAGQSRMAAGHRAHAWRHFRAYVETPGLSADDRAAGESRLRAAETGTTPVALVVTPADARVSVHRVGSSAQPRPPLSVALRAGAAELRLDPGPWEVRVEAAGAPPRTQRLDVGDEPMRVILEPSPSPAPAGPASQPHAGRAETVAGAVLVPLGLLALGGLTGVAVAHRHTRGEFEPLHAKYEQGMCLADEVLRLEELAGAARRQEGAMIGLGVAAGVLLGAGIGLLVHGRVRARAARVTLDVRPGSAGVALTGRF